MTNALDRGTPFNPMRFREEIKNVELSVAKLELLLKQYKICLGLKEHTELAAKINQEFVYLKNSWQDLERKLQDIAKTELPFFFIKEQMKKKINHLIEEVSQLTVEHF